MVSTIRRDLPLTRSLRQRHYNPSDISAQPIEYLRRTTEARRSQLFEAHRADCELYCQALEAVASKACSDDALVWCEVLCRRLKVLIEDCRPLSWAEVQQAAASIPLEQDRLGPLLLQFLQDRL